MNHVLFADKSLLLDDVAAETLVAYGALLGKIGSADSVEVSASNPGGDAVTVRFLLNSGTALVIETAHTDAPEPDNRSAVDYMRQRMAAYSYIPGDTETAFDLDESE